MNTRIDYYRINPRAIDVLASVNKHVGSIDPRLRALVELRVSQINGCVYCVDLHATEARHAGESQQRLDCLVVWEESTFFSDKERAALAWAEALTHVSSTHAPDELYARVRAHFTDQEIVDLNLIVSLMNAWNRMSIGLRKVTPVRG